MCSTHSLSSVGLPAVKQRLNAESTLTAGMDGSAAVGTMPAAAESNGVMRSRWRGLSWDRKHQGWRVRIYFAGKQRHVGRFEDDVTAAKAYDKAAVYLYGANAITNFGLEACQADLTEVSAFIVLAKEQADQEQLVRSQQRQQHYMLQPHHHRNAAADGQLGPLHSNFGAAGLHQTALLQQQHQHSLVHAHSGSPIMAGAADGSPGAWTAHAAASGAYPGAAVVAANSAYNFANGSSFAGVPLSQQHQQQVWLGHMPTSVPLVMQQPGMVQLSGHQGSIPGQYVLVHPDNTTHAHTACGAAAANGTSPNGTTNGYVLCASQNLHNMVLPTPAGPSAAAGAPTGISTADPSLMMSHMQQQQPRQQQPQLQQQQQHHHQQQQHLMVIGAASNTAVAAPGSQAMPLSHMPGVSLVPTSSAQLQQAVGMQQAAAVGGVGVAVSGAPGAPLLPPGSVGIMPQSIPEGPVGTGSSSSGGVGGSSFVKDMLQGLAYTTSAAAAPDMQHQQAYAAAAVSSSRPLSAVWCTSQAPSMDASCGPMLPGIRHMNGLIANGTTDGSPTFSSTSSNSGGNAALRLTLMNGASSTACA